MIGSIGNVDKKEILKVASWLWDNNLKTDIFYTSKKQLGEQLKTASNRGANWFVMIAEDELRLG